MADALKNWVGRVRVLVDPNPDEENEASYNFILLRKGDDFTLIAVDELAHEEILSRVTANGRETGTGWELAGGGTLALDHVAFIVQGNAGVIGSFTPDLHDVNNDLSIALHRAVFIKSPGRETSNLPWWDDKK